MNNFENLIKTLLPEGIIGDIGFDYETPKKPRPKGLSGNVKTKPSTDPDIAHPQVTPDWITAGGEEVINDPKEISKKFKSLPVPEIDVPSATSQRKQGILGNLAGGKTYRGYYNAPQTAEDLLFDAGNLNIVDDNVLKILIGRCYRQKTPLFILGLPGMGKTTITELVSESLAYNLGKKRFINTSEIDPSQLEEYYIEEYVQNLRNLKKERDFLKTVEDIPDDKYEAALQELRNSYEKSDRFYFIKLDGSNLDESMVALPAFEQSIDNPVEIKQEIENTVRSVNLTIDQKNKSAKIAKNYEVTSKQILPFLLASLKTVSGLLFIDEFLKLTPQTRSVLFGLPLERKTSPKGRLSDYMSIVCAANNPYGGGSSDISTYGGMLLSPAEMDRFEMVYYCQSLDKMYARMREEATTTDANGNVVTDPNFQSTIDLIEKNLKNDAGLAFLKDIRGKRISMTGNEANTFRFDKADHVVGIPQHMKLYTPRSLSLVTSRIREIQNYFIKSSTTKGQITEEDRQRFYREIYDLVVGQLGVDAGHARYDDYRTAHEFNWTAFIKSPKSYIDVKFKGLSDDKTKANAEWDLISTSRLISNNLQNKVFPYLTVESAELSDAELKVLYGSGVELVSNTIDSKSTKTKPTSFVSGDTETIDNEVERQYKLFSPEEVQEFEASLPEYGGMYKSLKDYIKQNIKRGLPPLKTENVQNISTVINEAKKNWDLSINKNLIQPEEVQDNKTAVSYYVITGEKDLVNDSLSAFVVFINMLLEHNLPDIAGESLAELFMGIQKKRTNIKSNQAKISALIPLFTALLTKKTITKEQLDSFLNLFLEIEATYAYNKAYKNMKEAVVYSIFTNKFDALLNEAEENIQPSEHIQTTATTIPGFIQDGTIQYPYPLKRIQANELTRICKEVDKEFKIGLFSKVSSVYYTEETDKQFPKLKSSIKSKILGSELKSFQKTAMFEKIEGCQNFEGLLYILRLYMFGYFRL